MSTLSLTLEIQVKDPDKYLRDLKRGLAWYIDQCIRKPHSQHGIENGLIALPLWLSLSPNPKQIEGFIQSTSSRLDRVQTEYSSVLEELGK